MITDSKSLKWLKQSMLMTHTLKAYKLEYKEATQSMPNMAKTTKFRPQAW